MEAMLFWSTAVLYLFKEVLSYPEKIINVGWIRRLEPILARMEVLDPTWGGGAVQFTWSLYYGILPKSLGGSEAESFRYLRQAVDFGGPWLLSRWGRARYFHLRDGKRIEFEQDMSWVLAQDVRASGEAYCWRAFFQADARQMLAIIDNLF
jgi:hypothetical protein